MLERVYMDAATEKQVRVRINMTPITPWMPIYWVYQFPDKLVHICSSADCHWVNVRATEMLTNDTVQREP